MKNVKAVINIIYLTLFYKVFYSEERQGLMIRKRIISFIIVSPLTIPFWAFCSIFDYIKYVLEYNAVWIEYDKSKKLTFKQRLAIKLNLQ